jgi:hypothetical protein
MDGGLRNQVNLLHYSFTLAPLMRETADAEQQREAENGRRPLPPTTEERRKFNCQRMEGFMIYLASKNVSVQRMGWLG